MSGNNFILPEYVAKIKSDPFARFLGVKLIELKKGYCKIKMKVTSEMANFHGLAHGSVIFALADIAFAAASNSHGRRALALNMNIAYRRPAFPGDWLVAEAIEESLGNTTALYHIKVKGPRGKLIASCHGVVFRTEESILKEFVKRVTRNID